MSQDDTRADRLGAALDAFVQRVPEIEAAAVVSYDGLPMASALPPGIDDDRLGALGASLLSLGEQASGVLGRGLLEQVFLEGSQGLVLLRSARDQAVLVAMAGRGARLGAWVLEMRHAAEAIGAVLDPVADTPESQTRVDQTPGDRTPVAAGRR